VETTAAARKKMTTKTKIVAAWATVKSSTVNLANKFRRAKETIQEVDSITYELALAMKKSMDKAELLEMANDLEQKSKLLRQIAKTIDE
jgi:Na+/phosphate symporter